MKTKARFPHAFNEIFRPYRYKVFYGGRGSGKSYSVAQALVMRAAQEPTRVLCCREFQQSIQESVHKLLSDTIERLGLEHIYDIQKATILCNNGSQFIFEGLKNNVTKVKSLEGVDVCWVEEGEAVSENSWDVLVPTIRKEGSEIWVTFNPNDEMDETYQRFVVDTPENCLLEKVNFDDNPWFPEELRKEMEECKRTNYKKYLHIWEGECANDYEDSIIQPEWVEASIDAHLKLAERNQRWDLAGVRCTGFDPADEGSDAKAVAFRHGTIATQCKQWDGGDIDDAINTAFSYADDWRSDVLVYDSIGIGASIKVGLEKRLEGKKIDVEGFCGSEKPTDPKKVYEDDRKNQDMFYNKRAQWWWYLRDRFYKTYLAVEKGEYVNPEDLISLSSDIEDLTQLKSELCRVQRKRGQNNSKILLESKAEMLKRGVKSPNMADALVMCFANSPPRVKPKEIQFPKRW